MRSVNHQLKKVYPIKWMSHKLMNGTNIDMTKNDNHKLQRVLDDPGRGN
jgi:hypothetical protein